LSWRWSICRSRARCCSNRAFIESSAHHEAKRRNSRRSDTGLIACRRLLPEAVTPSLWMAWVGGLRVAHRRTDKTLVVGTLGLRSDTSKQLSNHASTLSRAITRPDLDPCRRAGPRLSRAKPTALQRPRPVSLPMPRHRARATTGRWYPSACTSSSGLLALGPRPSCATRGSGRPMEPETELA
jgi:hypothetical protein